MSNQGFDRDVDDAWADFQSALADYVGAMCDDDVLVLSDGTEDGACIQFFAWGADMVRCEVPSNEFLSPTRQLPLEGQDRLRSLGFRYPDTGPNGSASFYFDRNRSWSDTLVRPAVAALREVWTIAHPSFLQATTGGRDETPAFDFIVTPRPVPGLATAVEPVDRRHLQMLVEATLEAMLGHAPALDAEGDIPLHRGRFTVYVSVLDDEPMIDIAAPLIMNVPNLTHAAEVIADQNRRWPEIKLLLAHGGVVAVLRLDANPYVGRHLLTALTRFGELLSVVDELFVAQIGGTGLWNDEEYVPCVAHYVPDRLFDLVHAEGTDAEQAARICEHTQATILEYLEIGRQQVEQWIGSELEAAYAGDTAAAEQAHAEARSWEQTIETLHQALTVVRRPTLPAAQLELFAPPGEPTLFDE